MIKFWLSFTPQNDFEYVSEKAYPIAFYTIYKNLPNYMKRIAARNDLHTLEKLYLAVRQEALSYKPHRSPSRGSSDYRCYEKSRGRYFNDYRVSDSPIQKLNPIFGIIIVDTYFVLQFGCLRKVEVLQKISQASVQIILEATFFEKSLANLNSPDISVFRPNYTLVKERSESAQILAKPSIFPYTKNISLKKSPISQNCTTLIDPKYKSFEEKIPKVKLLFDTKDLEMNNSETCEVGDIKINANFEEIPGYKKPFVSF